MVFSIIFFSAFFVPSLSTQIVENVWGTDNLKGSVRYYSRMTYSAEKHFCRVKKGEKAGSMYGIEDISVKFDEKGNITEKQNFDQELKTTFVYNDKGVLVEENLFDLDNNHKLIKNYIYDKTNKLIDENWFYPINGETGNLSSQRSVDLMKRTNEYKCLYDGVGNKISESRYSYHSDSVVETRSDYYYDTHGILYYSWNLKIFKSFHNFLKSRTIYEYDNHGNVIDFVKETFNHSGGLQSRYRYVKDYDTLGNLIKKEKYNSNEILEFRYTYEYDKNSKLISKTHLSPEFDGQSKTIFKYDRKGNLTIDDRRYIYLKENRSIVKITYKYTYDRYGNWIKRIKFIDHVPDLITERKIEYYE